MAKLEEEKIQAEQQDLETERTYLEGVLGSRSKMTKLMRDELTRDLETYGDDRHSPIVVRQEARALREDQLVASEPVTVVLSDNGWIRSAKGHDIDPGALSYKAGDQYLTSVQGRSTPPLVAFDTSGRAHSVPTHTLPSARSQGEPPVNGYGAFRHSDMPRVLVKSKYIMPASIFFLNQGAVTHEVHMPLYDMPIETIAHLHSALQVNQRADWPMAEVCFF